MGDLPGPGWGAVACCCTAACGTAALLKPVAQAQVVRRQRRQGQPSQESSDLPVSRSRLKRCQRVQNVTAEGEFK